MAATLLNRATFVRVPPRAVGERAFVTDPVLAVRVPGASEAWAATSLEAMPDARAVVLLLDARDVSLLALKLPPLSGRRLAQAVPNLLEDVLLQDPQTCAIVPGPGLGDGERVVAVTDRAWLAFVVGAIERRGLRVAAVWPGQLALPLAEGRWSAVLAGDGLALRTGPVSGFGWALPAGAADAGDALDGALDAALSAAPRPAGIDLLEADAHRRETFDRAAGRHGLTVAAAGAFSPEASPIDLLDGLGAGRRTRWAQRIDWRAWRIPAWTAAACLLAFLVGLNLHWASMTRERAALRARMEATFRDTFPGATVVVDPVLQMQRQLSDLRLGAGRSGPSDFLPLLARFADALGEDGVDALAALEYRDGRLRARPKAGALEDPARREALRAACRQRGLSVEFEGEAGATTLVVGVQA